MGSSGSAAVYCLKKFKENYLEDKEEIDEELREEYDIVITALGDPHFLKGEMIKDGAVVIDVGITRVEDNTEKGYHLAGDVDFESCAEKASWITPVPGGVGPMTRAMLMKNTLLAYKHTIYKD